MLQNNICFAWLYLAITKHGDTAYIRGIEQIVKIVRKLSTFDFYLDEYKLFSIVVLIIIINSMIVGLKCCIVFLTFMYYYYHRQKYLGSKVENICF